MTSKLKIIRTDCELECPVIDSELRAQGAELVLLPHGVSMERLVREIRGTDLLLTCYTPVTAAVLQAAARLRGIVKYGVGIDAIDISAARDHRVPVVNIPDYAEETVAEGAFALLIALAKKLVPLDRQMHRDGWLWPTRDWLGSDIADKVVGVVGLGRIGKSMARMAGAGFRARVLGYDPCCSAEDMQAVGVEHCENLTEMMAACDFVTLHAVLNEATRGMIGEAELAAMKPTAFLINVSRGALVDEAALVRALTEKRIAGAGLDVYSQEPLSLAKHVMSTLFDMPNVILLPHLTFFTKEAMDRLEREVLERCAECLAGGPVRVKSPDRRLRDQEHRVKFVG